MNLKKNGKVFTSKFVGTGPSSDEKRIYRAAVSQSLNNTVLDATAFKTIRPKVPHLVHARAGKLLTICTLVFFSVPT